jgi:hypothetical protein
VASTDSTISSRASRRRRCGSAVAWRARCMVYLRELRSGFGSTGVRMVARTFHSLATLR